MIDPFKSFLVFTSSEKKKTTKQQQFNKFIAFYGKGKSVNWHIMASFKNMLHHMAEWNVNVQHSVYSILSEEGH